jgi:phospholipid/cholesterol/gamma-HCH transport system substrate-binding protein
MRMTRRIWWQLALVAVISLTAVSIMIIGYIRLPTLFGIGRYHVTVELQEGGGLYKRSNVTYRGSEVGTVQDVRLTPSGVKAVLSLRSDVAIPSNLEAEVHSQTAVGEQYVELLPRDDQSAALKDGDVISVDRTSIPPDINSLLDATNRGLQAIPGDNLQTAVDQAYTAVGGLGPELARIVDGSTKLSTDARAHLGELTDLIDQSGPVLDTQDDTSGAIRDWASHLANITGQLRANDAALAGTIRGGAPAAGQVRQLFDRLNPTLPVLLTNLVTLGNVAVTYRDSLEQLLVVMPQGIASEGALLVPNQNTKLDYKGIYLDFNLNVNLPPPCTTGYLPAQQMRSPVFQDAPDRPVGDMYCRIPQDSMFDVRGARNLPCITRPGKRAPTVKMCESDENYVPLNDGYAWKGDPNATLSGQPIPQLPPGAPSPQPPTAPPPPVAFAEYDPATGDYTGPDGKSYTQANLSQDFPAERTWQAMLVPPGH